MKFLVHTIKRNSITLNTISSFLKDFNKSDFEIFLLDSFIDFISENNINIKNHYKSISLNEIKNSDIDFILSFGGDGTVLKTIDIIKDKNIPVIGINTGTLGFLTKFTKTSSKIIINSIENNRYNISKKNVLEVSFGHEKMYALNEVSITRHSVEMLEIITQINGNFLAKYRADGLIISTATGSTAYSLSCGGPILMPEVEDFILTPIAPHNLNFRPIIIPKESTIDCSISHKHLKNQKFNLTADTKNSLVDENIDISIKKANFSFKMLEIDENDFFDTIREKLLWGEDYRV